MGHGSTIDKPCKSLLSPVCSDLDTSSFIHDLLHAKEVEMKRYAHFFLMSMLFSGLILGTATLVSAAEKPNILVIWGDDIGTWNISHNNRGMMGFQTPNIDRIAQEGVSFTDYYGQQSCTAGRAAFISGSVPVRSGMTKVGLPGAAEGWQKTDVTMATVLKSQGYATGQFGKNHEGDRNEHLPTIHGFDEFLGNLYHLNAEEEPENEDYPRDMKLANGKTFLETFGPRGVLHCYATDTDDPTEIPRFGAWGK